MDMQMPEPILPPSTPPPPGEPLPGDDLPPLPVGEPPSDLPPEPVPMQMCGRAGSSRLNLAVKSILLSGTAAGVASTLALGLLARVEGKSVFQPVNSTSHWLNGERAASLRGADATHTAVGLATHQAATFFWAGLFEWWISGRRPLRPIPMLGHAVGTSVLAAAVDYGATPKRFTPGWEFVLSKQYMAAAYAAMTLGLAAGALMAQPSRYFAK